MPKKAPKAPSPRPMPRKQVKPVSGCMDTFITFAIVVGIAIIITVIISSTH